MNRRSWLIGLAAVVGILAAVAVFILTSPADGPNGRKGKGRKGRQAQEQMLEQSTGPGKAAVKKDPAGASPTPEAAAAEALVKAPFGQHASKAAPSWTGVATELTKAGQTELAAEARQLASDLRTARRSPEPDQAGLMARQRALVAKVRAAGVPATDNLLARVEALITELETGTEAPVAPMENEAAPQ